MSGHPQPLLVTSHTHGQNVCNKSTIWRLMELGSSFCQHTNIKKKMKKRREGKQKSCFCHHNMSLSSDSFLFWFPPLHTFAKKNIWLHPHDSHTYLLMWLSVHPVTVWCFQPISHTQDEQWDIVTLEVTLRHDTYAARLHAEGWDHTRTFTHFPLSHTCPFKKCS